MGNLGPLVYSIQWRSLGPLVYGGETGVTLLGAWLVRNLPTLKCILCFGIGAFSRDVTMCTMQSTILLKCEEQCFTVVFSFLACWCCGVSGDFF